jgi:hypothetical protein
VAGAVCGAAGHAIADLRSLFIPIAGLVLLGIVDVFAPLAIRDEQEQVNAS